MKNILIIYLLIINTKKNRLMIKINFDNYNQNSNTSTFITNLPSK